MQEFSPKYQVGDVVRLVSSPQRMTVEAVSENGIVVSCVWISDVTGTVERTRFCAETLVLVCDTATGG